MIPFCSSGKTSSHLTRMLVEVALIERKLRGATLGSVNRCHENHYFIASPCWWRHGKIMEGHLLNLGVKFVKEILGCFERDILL